MDSYQITAVILLTLVVLVLVTGLIIGYKAIVRRDAAAVALQNAINGLLSRLIEIEAALKGHLPALERSSGESGKHLLEITGHLRTIDQANTKLLGLNEEVNALLTQLKTSSDDGVSTARSIGESTNAGLVALSQQLIELRKQFDEVTKF